MGRSTLVLVAFLASAAFGPPALAGLPLLRVESDPAGAELRVNGRLVGDTPWVGNVVAGAVQLELRRSGHHAARRTVQVAQTGDDAPQVVRIRLDPLTGRLAVTSTPDGAAVRVLQEGRPVANGTTPWERDDVPVGTYTIEVGKPGHGTDQRDVEVVADATCASDFVLEVLPPPPERFFLGLAAAEGLVHVGGETWRTNVELELTGELDLGWVGLGWLRASLGAGVTVEEPASLLLRPGVRFDLDPVFIRPAALLLVAPAFHAGAYLGVGGELPFGAGWYGKVEAGWALWPEKIELIDVQLRLGVSHAL